MDTTLYLSRLKVIVSDTKEYGNIADEEPFSLLRERDDKVSWICRKRTVCRASLIVFLALSSAAIMCMINRQEDSEMMAKAGLHWRYSSSSTSLSSSWSPSSSSQDFWNGGFTGGKGNPIFVIENPSSCDPPEFIEIIENAKQFKAYIIIGESSMLDGKFEEPKLRPNMLFLPLFCANISLMCAFSVEAVREKLECNRDETHPDYCGIMMFDCGDMSGTIMSVNVLDDSNGITEVGSINSKDPNNLVNLQNTITNTIFRFDLLTRPDEISDGPLRPLEVLEPVQGASRDKCKGQANWNSTTKVYHLTLEEATHTTVVAKKFRTRTLNGKLPGPLIKIKAGEWFRVIFHNKLPTPPEPHNTECDNKYCNPNHGNLHYHGAHISENEPSDDPELSIAPDECYNYESKFPKNHMPGTHWIHPHFHGSSTLQIGAGAALPFIIEDSEFPVPDEVKEANDVLLFVQSFNHDSMEHVKGKIYENNEAVMARDTYQFEPITNAFNKFRLVNGQYNPHLVIQPGEWNRLQVVYGGWDNSRRSLNFNICASNEECEQYLLAKDGIYIKDYPREIDDNIFPIPTGGRADIMVRCNVEGTINVTSYHDNERLMTIRSIGSYVKSKPLTENYEWKFPAYLEDVTDEPILMGPDGNCSCPTVLKSRTINGEKYRKNVAVHTIEFGQVIERRIQGIRIHPYHQHVYPFQLTQGFDLMKDSEKNNTSGGFFKNGDWHDTIKAPDLDRSVEAHIKFNASAYTGKVMIHCHRSVHENEGMMSKELVSLNTPCQCNARIDVKDWIKGM